MTQLPISCVIIFYFSIDCSEVEQSLAISISDRATDEVIEALTRCRRGLDISDSQTVSFDNAETPDIVRSRSSQDSMGFVQIRDLDLPHRNLDSPTVSNLLLVIRPFHPHTHTLTHTCTLICHIICHNYSIDAFVLNSISCPSA